MTSTAGHPTGQQPRLRRTLATWAAISLSVAAMGASLAININPQGAGATVGRAVPLTFVLATIGVLLVAYGFARICSRLSHAGSVFGLTGITIGPRAGVVAGWALLGAYLSFMLTTSMTAGIFGAEFLRGLGLYKTTPDIVPWIIALVSVGIATLLAISPVKKSMATLLWVEICTTAVIAIIAVVVVVRVVGGNAPGGQRFTLDMFTVPPGTSTSTLFLGIVFGFLSFAGFEAAASLGEETTNPKRAIPIAIFGVALFGGLFYIIGTSVQMLGFGTDAAGVDAFSKSASLFGTLGEQYIGAVVGDLVTLGTAVSAMGCALATAVAASRLLFALNRGAFDGRGFTKVSPKTGTPISATLFVCGLAAAIIVLVRVAVTDTAFDLFAWSGTVGTLVLLVAYGLFSVGAWYYLCFRAPRQGHKAAAFDYVVPLLAIAVIGYTMFRNVIPWPDTASGRANIIIATGWVVAIVVVIVAAPKATRRIAQSLNSDEGLASEAGYLAVAVEEVDEGLREHNVPTAAPGTAQRGCSARAAKSRTVGSHLDIDDHWTYHGLKVVRLQNRHLALDVLPQRGANILQLLDKHRDLNVLWKSPRVAPHLAAVHSDFDDHWAGGWDDAFPGGRASRNRYGDQLPYMGEIWTAPAEYRLHRDPTSVSLTTTVRTPITPAELDRTITLRADEQRFTLSYRLRNIGTLPFDYNWGIHPSLAIRPGMRFDIPATGGIVDEAGGEVLGRPGDTYDWPVLRGYDLRHVTDIDVGAFALHYLTGLTAGWVAATDVPDRRGFGLCFDHALFPVVWFCLAYGGWRGYQQALIEPWTGYPSPLQDAVTAGRSRLLNPGESQTTEVVATFYDAETVAGLHPDGTVD